jgi:hypothetical protein
MNTIAETIRGHKSLKSILAGFSKVVEELQTLQQQNHNKVKENSEKISKLQDTNTVLILEADKAAKVQENITKLIS